MTPDPRAKRLISLSIFTLALIAVLFGFARQQTGTLEPETEDEARLNRLLPPAEIMEKLGVIPDMIIAEIGAGRGRFVVHLAKRLGSTGRVYAEDIDTAALNHLKKRCERLGFTNVETITGDIIDPKLPGGELDLMVVISSYHHFADPVALLRNARSALKPEGRLAVVEWLPWSESDKEGTSREILEAQMDAAGYTLERIESLSVAKPLNIYIFRKDDG
jgi:ubiquinone/menaquinone biosynthesis C-methylase UbiE